MTLDELVDIARTLVKADSEEMRNLAAVIIDLLAEASPGGWDRPWVTTNGQIQVPLSWAADISPEDARHLARMLLRAADEAIDKAPVEVSPVLELYPPPVELTDIRAAAMKGQDRGGRAWSKVTGICLHQTACLLGERPGRWETVGAHVGVMRSGRVVWIHDFDRIVWHGNGWNAGTVGVEIDGLYEGVEGDARTLWDDPATSAREKGMTPTVAAIEATKQTIRWICSEVAKNGGAVKALVAHRQSSDARRNDPGSALWKAVALPMMVELGLSDGGIGFKIGSGYAIPEAWDPRCKGVKY